ncbi:hypothetical protein TNCV_4545641 [Trichonephila clavipes]|nr:hypothetical protein TNCV_4545641 [Trichonephila clavipes]
MIRYERKTGTRKRQYLKTLHHKHPSSPTPKKAKTMKSAGKVMTKIFFDYEGIVHQHAVEPVSRRKVSIPLYFHEQSHSAYFLDMLTLWLMLQLQEDINNFLLQLDGAPPYWSLISMNITLIDRSEEPKTTHSKGI